MPSIGRVITGKGDGEQQRRAVVNDRERWAASNRRTGRQGEQSCGYGAFTSAFGGVEYVGEGGGVMEQRGI
jgi:hypothetical protein